MAKKEKKGDDAPAPQGAPDWVVTFTDMISLLVTFFVLLMTFSSVEEYNKLRIEGLMGGTTGSLKSIGGSMAREAPEEDQIAATDILRGADMPHTRPAEHLEENLEEMGQKDDEDHTPLDFNNIADGLRIHFGPQASFKPGSAEVNKELDKSLKELGAVLQYYRHLVVIEGFTDDQFKASDQFPTEESLSLARARNATEAMLKGGELSPKMIQIAGLGTRNPIGDNKDLLGRRLNRRVEAHIVSLSKDRFEHVDSLQRKRDSDAYKTEAK